MSEVVSLGSVNVDRIRRVSPSEIADLQDRYDWFPDRGETVAVDDVPAAFPLDYDELRHGGKGANQAVAAACADAAADLAGKVGLDHDRFGVLDRLRDAGVGVSLVGTAGEPTGTAHVFVGPEGDNWIVVRPGANGTVDEAFVRDRYDAIRSADCLVLQNEVPVEPVRALLAELSSEPDRPTVVLDPAPAEGAGPLVRRDAVDYCTPNENEYQALRSSLEGFDGVVVRTRGADDVVVEGDRQFRVTPPSVRTVDSTGAGDVLTGFLAARLSAGASVRDAVETGAVAGALSTREEGARGGVPTLAEVREFRSSSADGA